MKRSRTHHRPGPLTAEVIAAIAESVEKMFYEGQARNGGAQ